MATTTYVTTPRSAIEAEQRLTPDVALRYAWYCWLGLLAIPFFVFLYIVFAMVREDNLTATLAMDAQRNSPVADRWFVGCMAYLIFLVPAAIFLRSRIFKSYWSGDCVSPRSYLTGMLTVWITIEIGGLLSLAGCIVTGAMLPNLLPALTAFMLFTPLWPSGRAMVCSHKGDSDDPEHYEEPR